MTALYLKAVHIIFIVTWFAGLFYIPRLFVYIIETHQKPEPEKSILLKQLLLMTTRLWYGITWPSAVITLAMGISLLVNQPFWLNESFMIIKLVLVGLLYGYHFSLQYLFNQLRRNVVTYTSQHMRLWNEVATLFLIGIVFLIVLKSALSMVLGIIGLLIVTLLIVLGIFVYKRVRRS